MFTICLEFKIASAFNFIAGDPMPYSSAQQCAVTGLDGMIYIFGHTTSDEFGESIADVNTTLKFDPIKQQYTQMADMPTSVR